MTAAPHLAADEVRPGDRIQFVVEATVDETMGDGLLGVDFLTKFEKRTGITPTIRLLGRPLRVGDQVSTEYGGGEIRFIEAGWALVRLRDGACISAKLADLVAAEQPLRETR